jgi:hypothetical protein
MPPYGASGPTAILGTVRPSGIVGWNGSDDGIYGGIDRRMDREFKLIHGLDWPAEIDEAWDGLVARNHRSSFVQSRHWYRSCLENLEGAPDSAVVVIAERRGTVEAILPLRRDTYRVPGAQVSVLRVPRHSHISLHDVVLNDEVDHEGLLSELLQFLRSHGEWRFDAILFGDLLDGSSLLELLCADASLRSIVYEKRACHCLPVMSDDELREHTSKNLHKNLRRVRRKLERQDQHAFLTTRGPRELEAFFERFLEVEASGWKGAAGRGSAIALDSSLHAHYRQLVKSLGDAGQCEIRLLEVNGQTAAALLAWISGDTVYTPKIGYDEEFASLMPGALLLADTVIRLSAEGGTREINMVSDASWTTGWRPERRPVYSASLFAKSPKGALLFRYLQLRAALDRWLRRRAPDLLHGVQTFRSLIGRRLSRLRS